MTPHHPDPEFATTLAHGLAVLQAFTISQPSLNNKELAVRTGLSKATISRLTYTLAARGLVVFDEQLRRYRLGSTALTIGYPLLAGMRIRRLARARMAALAKRVGGSVSLGIRDRTHMVYVETSRGHDLSSWRPDIGAAVPMLPSAMGRAWLAAAAPDVRRAVLAELLGSARARAPEIERAVRDLQQHGFSISRGDWRPDVHAVAVPVRIEQDGETLVFNCGVLATRLKPRALEKEVGPQLVRLARAVEAELQAQP